MLSIHSFFSEPFAGIMNSKLSSTFLVIFLFLCVISSEVRRPRGVSLSRVSLYPPEKNFTCFDGSKTIAFTQVNDDYCDCDDASDEPGTSACAHGIFHCTNAGHKPMNVPSSVVNDGICDCCDGADEYSSSVTCVNNCIELGRSARDAAQRKAELIKAGKQMRSELIQKGMHLKQEKKIKLGELEKNRQEAEKLKTEKEALKKEAEELENVALEYYRKLEEVRKQRELEIAEEKNKAEAVETFNSFDSNQDGLLEINELRGSQSFDKDRNGEVSEEEAMFFLNNQQSVDLESFVNSCWTNVKQYLMMDSGLSTPPSVEVPSSNEEDDMQEESDDEANEDEDNEHQGVTDQLEEVADEESKDEPPSIVYDDETQKLVERAAITRTEFNEAETQVRNIENEIKSIKEYLQNDFGTEEEFAPLQGQCFEFEDHEYIYKLCPFDKTSQQPLSGSSETRLGTWGRWADTDHHKYSTMMFERGQTCWNGPQRTTQVRIHCGGENKITSVSEPNRCEYLFEFETPAACIEQAREDQDDLHDEL